MGSILEIVKKAKVYLILALIIAILLSFIYFQFSRIKAIKADRDIYKRNTNVLLQDVKKYQTKDSLNAATVGELELTISQFERYRQEDAELIRSLETKNRDLKGVITTESKTTVELSGIVRDSIIYINNVVVDTLYCVDISDKWFNFEGCTKNKNEFTGTFENFDSILVAETVKYKRFLGFLWKTSKVKDRKIDVVNKNPHTKILGVEFTTIRK